MPAFGDPHAEMADFEAVATQRRQTELAAAGIGADAAQNISQIGAYHPYMDPGTATALGQSGLSPLSPVVLLASKLRALVEAQKPQGYATWGDAMRAADDGATQAFVDSARHGGNVGLGDVVGAYEQHPVVKAALAAPEQIGGVIPSPVRDAVKQASRLNSTWNDFLPQYVQAGYKTGVMNVKHDGLFGGIVKNANPMSLVQQFEQTDLGQTFEQATGTQLEHQQFAENDTNARAAMATGSTMDEVTGGKLLQTVTPEGDMRFHNPDAGSGFFSGGEVAAQRLKAQQAATGGDPYGNGQTRTIGRDVASFLGLEPGSMAFHGVSGLADATTYLLSMKPSNALSADRKAAAEFASGGAQSDLTGIKRILNEIGGIDAARKTRNPQMVESFLNGGKGQELIDTMSSITDVAKLDRMTGQKLDPKLLTELADTTNPAYMRQILSDNLGLSMRTAPDVGGLSSLGERILEHAPRTAVRLNNLIPHSENIDMQDGRTAVTQLDRMLRNTNADEATVSTFVDRMARAGDVNERKNVYFDMLHDTGERLATEMGGGDQAVKDARKMTQAFIDNHSGLKAYNIDDIGNNVPNIDGTLGPHLVAEHLNRYMPVPDWRAMRQTMSVLSPMYDIPGVTVAQASLDSLQNGWKTATLMRLGLPIRTIGDHMGKMAAADLDSAFNHPIGYIQSVLGSGDGRIARMLDRVGVNGRGEVDAAGELSNMSDEMASVLGKSSSLRGTAEEPMDSKLKRIYDQGMQLYRPGDDGFAAAHAFEIGQLAADANAPAIAKALLSDSVDSAQAARDAMWENTFGRKLLDGRAPTRGVLTRTGSDAEADSIVARIKLKTQNDPKLLEAIATGKLPAAEEGGTPTRVFQWNSPKQNPEFAQRVGDEFAGVAPSQVKGPKWVDVTSPKSEVMQAKDRAVDWFFAHAIGNPNDKLIQSPTMRQYQWKHSIQLSSALDPQYADELIANARKANLSKSDIRQLSYFAKQPVAGLERTVSEATNAVAPAAAEPFAEGMPALYHGTSSRLANDALVPGKGRVADNLFGPGTYLTDNPDVAGQYMKKGSGDNPFRYSAQWTGGTAPKLFDADKAMPAEVRTKISAALDEIGNSSHLDVGEQDWNAAKKLLDEGGSTADVYAKIRGMLDGNPKSQVDEFIQSLNDSFHEAGFDGLTHKGGIYTGNVHHQVTVIFDDPHGEALGNIKLSPHLDTPGTPAVKSNGLTLDQLTMLANGHAADDTKKLLYDATEKGQFMDAARIVFPFGNVWKQSLQSWGQLLAERPEFLAKVGHLSDELQDPSVGQFLGAPQGKGFFWHDDQGNEMFAYPGSAGIVNKTLGYMDAAGIPTGGPMSVPLVGSVKGASLSTEVIPGVGPVSSLMLASIMDSTRFQSPAYDDLRNIIFPAGMPKHDLLNPVGTLTSNLTPPWVQKLAKAGGGMTPDDQRTYANQVMSVMQQKEAEGGYNLNGPTMTADQHQAEMNRLVDDSYKTANALWMIRAAAQFVSPSAPSYQWQAEDKSGQRVAMIPLINDYRKMQQTDPAHAIDNFTAKYGNNALLLMQGKTLPVSAALPAPTDALDKWVRQNGDVKSKYPLTYGFFAPHDPTSGFSSDAYMRQVQSGERKPITPEAMPRLANDMVAKSMYYQVHDQLLAARGKQGFSTLSATQSHMLQAYNDELMNQYPGYQDKHWDPTQSIKPAEYIRELQRTVKDPKLQDDPLAKAVSDYLGVRTQIQAASKAQFGSETAFASSKDATGLRAGLAAAADYLAKQEPRFGRVYERAFLPEIQTGLIADENRGVN